MQHRNKETQQWARGLLGIQPSSGVIKCY